MKSILDDNLNASLSLSSLASTKLNSVVDLYALVKNLNPNASKQERAYMYFEALHEQKILVSVQTPFKFFTNMAIERVIGIQGENGAFISDFTITLKHIRAVSELSVLDNGTAQALTASPLKTVDIGITLANGQTSGPAAAALGSSENTYAPQGVAGGLGAAGRALEQKLGLVQGGNMPGTKIPRSEFDAAIEQMGPQFGYKANIRR